MKPAHARNLHCLSCDILLFRLRIHRPFQRDPAVDLQSEIARCEAQDGPSGPVYDPCVHDDARDVHTVAEAHVLWASRGGEIRGQQGGEEERVTGRPPHAGRRRT